MTEEPQIGMRREGGGIGPVDREEGGGPYRVVLQEQPDEDAGEPTLQDLREAPHRRLRDGLRGAQPDLDLQVHRRTAAGRVLPPRPCPAGRGRRTRTSPAGRPGPQRRRAGRREPGMEAGPGGRRDVTGEPPGHLPRRTASGRCPGVAQHHGAGRAQGPDDRHQALRDIMAELLGMDEPRKRIAAMFSGLDIHYDLGEGHPLLGRRMPDLDVHTPDGPRACSPCCTTPGPCSSISVRPAVSTSHLGRIVSGWSTPSMLGVGAPSPRRDHCALGRADPTRRTCRLGGRAPGPRAASSTCDLVRRGHPGLEPQQLGAPPSSDRPADPTRCSVAICTALARRVCPSVSDQAYTTLSRHFPARKMVWRRTPSRSKPAFSSARCSAMFSTSVYASIRCAGMVSNRY